MSIGRAIASGFKNYGNFTGQASSREYWWWTLFSAAALVIPWIILQAYYNNSEPNRTNPGQLMVGFIAISIGWAILLLIPCVSMAARRLRDAGLSPWWGLLLLVPIPLSIPVVIIVFGLLPSANRQI